MQNLLLMLVSVLAFATNQILTRAFQVKIQTSKNSIKLYQSLFCLVAAILYFALAGIGGENFSAGILLSAIIFGLCFALAIVFLAKCMEIGFMSISAVVVNLSLILPVIFSWIILKEPVEILSVVGLLLIIITLVLSSASAGNTGGGNIKVWLLFVSIAFFTNGGSAITQKIYVADNGDGSLMMFMGVAYTVAALFFGIFYLFGGDNKNSPIKSQVTSVWLMILLAVFSGLGSFLGNGVLGYLSNKVNGGVLYPCINGGLSIAVALSSFIIFKEKFTLKKMLAIIIGIIAVVLLNI